MARKTAMEQRTEYFAMMYVKLHGGDCFEIKKRVKDIWRSERVGKISFYKIYLDNEEIAWYAECNGQTFIEVSEQRWLCNDGHYYAPIDSEFYFVAD